MYAQELTNLLHRKKSTLYTLDFCYELNYLANIRRSSGFCAAGMLRITCLSCSDRLASSVSVILLLSGESPPGSSSALELSILGLVRVMSSLLATHRKQTDLLGCYTSKSWAQERAYCGHTWGAKAESARGAETAASHSGSKWRVFIPQPRLILTGWYQQADISVQLDQQAALEHPHHHLNQLGLIRSRAAKCITAEHRITLNK